MIKVLLADDHKMVRDGLRYLLMAAGDIEIIAIASNGQEAVECAIQACPDVAVLDVSMPSMDGIEASRYIKDHCPNTGILMLSMYNTPEHVRRALRAGAQGYVLKDAAGANLVEAIRTLAAGGRYFSSGIRGIV
jgi:DNA-binding NarL/FixJ family response regulator